ncbi:MAG: DinB family protein, partial [Ktedonobacteraceae bacterium]
MAEHQLSLAPFYKGWDAYQQCLVEAIAPLTLEQLALRSSPQNWSVGMLVAHIVATRVWWFHTRMGEGSADLAPLELWDQNEEPLRPATELITGLERTWHMIQDALA